MNKYVHYWRWATSTRPTPVLDVTFPNSQSDHRHIDNWQILLISRATLKIKAGDVQRMWRKKTQWTSDIKSNESNRSLMVFFCGSRSVINEALLMLSLMRRCEREKRWKEEMKQTWKQTQKTALDTVDESEVEKETGQFLQVRQEEQVT